LSANCGQADDGDDTRAEIEPNQLANSPYTSS